MIRILFLFFLLILSGCLGIPPVQDTQLAPLKPGHGLFALTLNSIDEINHIYVSGPQNLVVKWPPKGQNIFIYEVPEGQYCMRDLTMGDYKVTFKRGYDATGFCSYVEAGTINYSGHIYLRAPTSTVRFNYPRFIELMSKKFPNICKEYIGDKCNG